MAAPRTYASASIFRMALDQRIKASSKSTYDFSRRQQGVIFDRFMARVVRTLGDAVMLKGGLVLELRVERSHATRDVDLRMVGSSDGLLANLQQAGRLDLGDYMVFDVERGSCYPVAGRRAAIHIKARGIMSI